MPLGKCIRTAPTPVCPRLGEVSRGHGHRLRAELLSIGSELLAGDTIDTNAAFLGSELAALGLPLRSARMLPDDRRVIADAFAAARRRCDLLIATGGLGPTHDDMTREALADALNEAMGEDADVLAALEARFGGADRMPATNRRQAMIIPSAEPLANPIGSAPGWWVDRDDVVVVLLPGVPSEMRAMWADALRDRLTLRFAPPPLARRTVKAFGIGESAVAERLGPILESPPEGVATGIYARDDGIHLRFSTRGDAAVLDRCVAEALDALGADAYGADDVELAEAALATLDRLGTRSLATRERGTGGSLLAILAEAAEGRPTDAAARYVGGTLHVGDPRTDAPASADTLLEVELLEQDPHGRSRVRVTLSGTVDMPRSEVRIHGSGPQRPRRAAYAALDLVRRLSASDR